MKDKYNYELLRDYLHGLVDTKTAREVGELIKNDEIARGIAEGIVRLEKEFKGDDVSVDNYLEDFRQKQLKLSQKSNPEPITKKIWLRIAASLLILISVGIVARLMVAKPDLQTIVNQELAQPYPLSSLVRSEGDETPTEKAFQLYAQGDFTNASIYFEQASTVERDDASVMFYNALCYLYVGRYEKAIALFGYGGIADSRYSQQAEWYLALSLLKSGNTNAATEIISRIAKGQQHFKNKEALQLLRQLE